MFIHYMQLQFLQGFVISLKVAQVVPSHGVYISLPNLVRQLSVIVCHKPKQCLVTQKPRLLNSLGVCSGDPDGLDPSNEKVPNPLNGLNPVDISTWYLSKIRVSTNLMCKTLQLRFDVMSGLDLRWI
jgi:hypothetical protein